VDLTFDIDPDLIETLKNIWVSKDVIVNKIGTVIDLHNTVFMVIGDVTASSMDAIMATAKEKAAVEACDIRISSSSSGRNTALVTASVKSEEDLGTLEEVIGKECISKGFTLIRGVE
ncbi:MAG: hypothetical protein J6Y18_02120, partial [Candidatus Methanomethylophilaceae archaeon]|nr:hypothetical protein [Candidatus Methanomethylophilaceae archaeon]